MLKYKILLNDKSSAMVKDFYQHMISEFDTLTTTDNWLDVTGHFKLFKPDAYVCFLDSVYSETVASIKKIKHDILYQNIPVIVIASEETCNELENLKGFIADVLIRRPISPDNLMLGILKYLEERDNIAGIERDRDTSKHILIVDDDRNVLKMLKNALSSDYDITTMLNGLLVEKFLETKKVDLIILDYEMPIMTGVEVFKKIKMIEKAKNIPICFLTGISERSKIEEIMALKPHGYLLKPINMDMFRSTISNLTSKWS